MEMIDQKAVSEFKSAVLAHIAGVLPASEWDRLRAIAVDPARSRVQGLESLPQATPAELVSAALSFDDMTLSEALPKPFTPFVSVVASGATWTVYYVSGEGIYVWAPHLESEPVMSVWLTHPAYPPSW